MKGIITTCSRPLLLTVAILVVSSLQPAYGLRLELPPQASPWALFGANLILYLHILGGATGLITGTLALATRKGGKTHRLAGRVFFISMLVCYAIGAGVAPFLVSEQRPNFVAGILALYLLLTAWLAARRRNPVVGAIEYVGLITAIFVLGCGLMFVLQAANHPSGTVDGSPPQAFVLFIAVGAVALFEDAYVLMRRQINGGFRVARHLWRMCMSMFIAGGAFFFGQESFLPDWFVGSGWQISLALFPLCAMVVWLCLIRFSGRHSPYQTSTPPE